MFLAFLTTSPQSDRRVPSSLTPSLCPSVPAPSLSLRLCPLSAFIQSPPIIHPPSTLNIHDHFRQYPFLVKTSKLTFLKIGKKLIVCREGLCFFFFLVGKTSQIIRTFKDRSSGVLELQVAKLRTRHLIKLYLPVHLPVPRQSSANYRLTS